MSSESSSDESIGHPSVELSSDESIGPSSAPPKRRGPTMSNSINNLPEGVILSVIFNSDCQSIDGDVLKFNHFIGTLARDCTLAPLMYRFWENIPIENKDDVRERIKARFDVNDSNRELIMQRINKKWWDFRSKQKCKVYNKYPDVKDQLVHKDRRILDS